MSTILSIQSSVAYGHVGNSAATFPLMRTGVEVWPVLTVHFSNHTGYPDWAGPMLTGDDVRAVVAGIDARGVLGRCDAVLSGYQGAPEMAEAILSAVSLVKERNPAAIYCCDPVLGDVGRGFYVRPGLPELMRDTVLPRADVLTPNHFELDFLAGGRQTSTLAEVLAAVDELRGRGPSTVLVTSVELTDGADDELRLVAVDGEGAWQVVTPKLDRAFTGSGDITAALFTAGLLEGIGTAQALARTASRVYSLLKATTDADATELRLVQAQEELVAPSVEFTAERIR